MNETSKLDIKRHVTYERPFSSSISNEQSLVKYRNGSSSKYLSQAPSSCAILPGAIVNFDAVSKHPLLTPRYPPPCLELIDSEEWIARYGLKANKLTLEDVLGMIGFKQAQNYENYSKQLISSKYSKGLFLQTHTKDGSIYNIIVNHAKIFDIAKRLEEAIRVFKLRLHWLTSDSRRLFGVITEQSICLVIDCKNKNLEQFIQYRNCILRLVKEQISKISSFNIIRCSNVIECFCNKSVVVSPQSIQDAINWLNEWNRDYVEASTDTTTTEAVLEAFKDQTIGAIYLISEGVSSNGTREILYDKLVKQSFEKHIRLNVISFNCNDLDTVEFLRRVAANSYGPGKFHAYCLLQYYEDFVPGPIDPDPTKNRVVMNKRMFGGVPSGAGIKKDAMLLFEEIQSARETLDHLKTIVDSMDKEKYAEEAELNGKLMVKELNDEYSTSKQWLAKNGLSAKRLDLFDVLRQFCFRHCDGVVDLKKEPITGKLYFVKDDTIYYQGDAVPSPKLVNAKYCDQFAHILWNDGTIMHVSVTADLHRTYEVKVKTALEQFERRIDWLSHGSRELFGTVIENNICILIDTSQSMQLSLDFVKRKLTNLIQEQLKSKQRFNLIAFNSKINSWRDRMVEVDETNMKSSIDWINSLSAHGTTNTLGAIKFALSDLNCEAIYLLSDGRPDQEPRNILSQVHLNTRIPIHTISFNCNDASANKFLSQLAHETGGRYHYFNENGWDADPDGPVPYESEDVSLLKKEIEKGQNYLIQLAKLRDECNRLSISDRTNRRLLNRSSLSQSENFTESTFSSKYKSKTSLDLYSNNGVLNSLHDIQSLEWILPETRALLERQIKNQWNLSLKKTPVKKPDELQKREIRVKKIKQISDESSLLKSHSRIAKWLEKNSLAALKLTIFDALLIHMAKSTTPENILVVDDLYEAKVWNEILELADVTGIDKKRFQFLNPATININEYESKLEKQIQIYRKFLAEQIWRVLPDIEKILLDYQVPSEFDDSNRELLLKSLLYCNWPISKRDIQLVEDQIELAKKNIRLIRELNYYILHKTELNKNSVRLESERELELKTEKSEIEIEALMNNAAKKEENFFRGDKVIARSDLLGYYFPAKISKVLDSRHANVKFENGARQEKMSFRNVIRLTGNQSFISLGDYVMAHVINEFDQKCWVPGIVQTIDQNTQPKVYTILYFNGQEGDNTRLELIRINKNTYGFIVNYIRARLGLNTNIKPYHEERNIEPPEPRPSTPHDMDELKKEIIDEIKNHFDSLKIDDKYQSMYEELLTLRKKQKSYKSDLDGKFKVLRQDFDEWKKQEPPVILPNPNLYIYQENKDKIVENVRLNELVVKSPPTPQRDLSVDEKLLKLRQDLPQLRTGEEVLAKWPDDGWYYRSIVKEYLGDYKYQVEDSLRDCEQIYREDIISEMNDSSDSFEEGDPVVALHPQYEFSYAPGQIVKISSDSTKLLIKFYDYLETVVYRKEVFKLPRIKFQLDVNNIINLEKKWIGETVVARNNYTKVYELGKIVNRVGNGRQYTIEWSNGKQSIENSIHIYGKFTRNQQILANDYVLAPKETIFLPGRVINRHGDQVKVKFFDGTTDENVSYEQCFWLSRDYYEDACNFYRREIEPENEKIETYRSNLSESSRSTTYSESSKKHNRAKYVKDSFIVD